MSPSLIGVTTAGESASSANQPGLNANVSLGPQSMKKTRAVLLCAAAQVAFTSLVSTSANAQQSSPIGRGSWIISGSAALSSNHDETTDQTRTSVSLSPTGLLFIRPRLAIGGALALGYSSAPNASFSTYGIGPSVRYYFGDMSGQLFPFVNASVIPIWQKTNVKNPTSGLPGLPGFSDATNRLVSFDGSAGLTRLVATHVGLTGEAYYTHLSNTLDLGSTTTSRASYDVGLRFGITVFVH